MTLPKTTLSVGWRKLLNLSLSCTILLLASCMSGDEAITAEHIVNESIKHHGGLEKYESLKSIKYVKKIILFDSLGNVESVQNQHHYYVMQPELSGTIWWADDADTVSIEFAGDDISRFTNGIPDTLASEASANLVGSSIYVLFQPFKLVDPGTLLIYEGVGNINNKEVDIVAVRYEGADDSADQWWYYFDTESHRLLANRVIHGKRNSLIQNLSFHEEAPLLLNQHRKSYFVDNSLEKGYLRAEYFYDDFEFTFEESD